MDAARHAGGSRANLFWYRLTGGLIGGSFRGASILLLTTTGRRSGRRRTTPLLYLRDGDDLVVVGSNAGDRRSAAGRAKAQRRASVVQGATLDL